MKYITVFNSETGEFEAVQFPEEGQISSGNTGYATGGDVYSVVGNVESALSSINTALEDLIGGE